MSNDKAVGIDLGTATSLIALVDALGQPEVLKNAEGDRITPSVALFDGLWSVGLLPQRQAVIKPDKTVLFVKRHMEDSTWSWKAADGSIWTPEQIAAEILKKLKFDAEQATGEKIGSAVITVPAHFGQLGRERTLKAGQFAGLKVLRLESEPTAAAMAYGLDVTGGPHRVAVCDFGGGTLDVSLLEISQKQIKVLTTDGDTQLGGKDFDEELLRFFAGEFKKTHGIDPLSELKVKQDWLMRAEQAKKDLSTLRETFLGLSANGKTLDLILKRSQFEAMIAPYLDRSRVVIERALKSKGLTPRDIDKVIPVGGTTRIPCVKDLIANFFGSKLESGVDPDFAVAQGASIVAALETHQPVRGRTGQRYLPSTTEVTPFALGVKAWDKAQNGFYNEILIGKDQPIPAQDTKHFLPTEDDATEVQLEVVQGETRDLAQCAVLGSFCLKGISPGPKDATEVEVTFIYDESGIVHVNAQELRTGAQLKVDINTKQPVAVP